MYHKPSILILGLFCPIDQRHGTCNTGSSKFVVASRCLARSLLKASVQELSIPVHTFNDLDDPEWHRYTKYRKVWYFTVPRAVGIFKPRLAHVHDDR